MKTLILKDTLQVNRNITRTVYTYKGVTIYHNVEMPLNPFKTQKQNAVVDYLVNESENTIDIYCPPGKGMPIFFGNEICLENAQEFIDQIKVEL